MDLLHDIQMAVIEEGTAIGPVLLKLRLLASRLGSAPLEEWVRYESEGYPQDTQLPDYRVLGVTYSGTFFGPFGSAIRDAPIPPMVIAKLAGEDWTNYKMRQSISAVDDLIKTSASGSGTLVIDAANLILRLQGKVYKDYACNAVTGAISRAAIVEIQHAVRSRVLELTIVLEKSLPQTTLSDLRAGNKQVDTDAERVTQITNQIIYGNVTAIASSGVGATFNLAVQPGDSQSFVAALTKAGISENDAADLASIVTSESPQSKEEPLGEKARSWLIDNLKKAASGTWKIGVSVATEVIKEATLKYYGLK